MIIMIKSIEKSDLLSWMAEEERNRIKMAQSERIAIAKERGAFMESLENIMLKQRERAVFFITLWSNY